MYKLNELDDNDFTVCSTLSPNTVASSKTPNIIPFKPPNCASPPLALALSGGAVRGVAHFGVLRALEEANIVINAIAGTSAGAIMAALYGLERAGLTPRLELDSLLEVLGKRKYADLNALTGGHSQTSWFKGLHRWFSFQRATSRGLRSLGISSLDPIRQGLEMLAGQHRFEDVLEFAGIPLAFVTSDVRTGERVVLKHGSLVEAALASSSILGVFDPMTLDGHLLSDGSSVENLPVEAARALLPGRNGIVLAVDVSLTSEPVGSPRNALEAFARGAVISQERLERASRKAADVVIVIGHEVPAHPFDFDRAEALFAAGFEAGRRVVPELRLALESAAPA